LKAKENFSSAFLEGKIMKLLTTAQMKSKVEAIPFKDYTVEFYAARRKLEICWEAYLGNKYASEFPKLSQNQFYAEAMGRNIDKSLEEVEADYCLIAAGS
jgi:hypothetical protein